MAARHLGLSAREFTDLPLAGRLPATSTRAGCEMAAVLGQEGGYSVSMAEWVAIRELRLAGLLDSSGGRHGRLVIPDRPRAIDRYINYFGGRVRCPGRSWLETTADRGDIAALSGLHRIADACRAVWPARQSADRRALESRGTNPCAAIQRLEGGQASSRSSSRRGRGCGLPFGCEVEAFGEGDFAARSGASVFTAGAESS
jgi:hypothetical protein